MTLGKPCNISLPFFPLLQYRFCDSTHLESCLNPKCQRQAACPAQCRECPALPAAVIPVGCSFVPQGMASTSSFPATQPSLSSPASQRQMETEQLALGNKSTQAVSRAAGGIYELCRSLSCHERLSGDASQVRTKTAHLSLPGPSQGRTTECCRTKSAAAVGMCCFPNQTEQATTTVTPSRDLQRGLGEASIPGHHHPWADSRLCLNF